MYDRRKENLDVGATVVVPADALDRAALRILVDVREVDEQEVVALERKERVVALASLEKDEEIVEITTTSEAGDEVRIHFRILREPAR